MAGELHPSSGKLSLHKEGSLGWLVIDNPSRRNALTLTMWRSLGSALKTLEDDPQVRVVIVTGTTNADGTPGDFSAGADISEFEETRSTAEAAALYDAANLDAFDRLRDCPKPTIALIHGNCLGGGLGLALACDLRIAAMTARFCLPPAKLGLAYPPSALSDVVNAIGPTWTKRLIYTGERLSADTALAIGLVQEVHAPEALDDALATLTGQITANAPLSQTAGKAAVAASLNPANDALAARAQSLASACYESKDLDEGRQAFLEKRKARFEGR